MIWIFEDTSKVGLGGGQQVTQAVMQAHGTGGTRLFDATDILRNRIGIEPEYFTRMRWSGRSKKELPSFSFPKTEYLCLGFQIVRNFMKVSRLARRERPTRIYVAAKKPLVLAVLLRKAGIVDAKIVYHAHNVFPDSWAARAFKRMVEANADDILCVSEHVYDSMHGSKRLVRNPLGQDPGVRRRQEISFPMRVGFIGSLLPWKGLDVFEGVAREADSRLFRFHLFTRDAKPHGLCDGVEYHHDESWGNILDNIDVLMVCSHGQESFSLTTLYAAAADIPVVFPDQPALNEIIDDGAGGECYTNSDMSDALRALYAVAYGYGQYHPRTGSMLERYSVKNFEEQIREVLS